MGLNNKMEITDLNKEQVEQELLNTRRKIIKLKSEKEQFNINVLREEKYLNELLNRYFILNELEKKKK